MRIREHTIAATWVLTALLGLVCLSLGVLGPFDAFDFRNAYLSAAHAVVDGRSPYPATGDWVIAHDRAYVYPPTLAVLLAPLALVPEWLAVLIATLVCVAAVGASLWLIGVRDMRIYLVVYLWAPVFTGLQNLNASILVTLLIAVAWRYRERVVIAGLAVGAAIALKLFVWPLVIWLAATRRWKAAAVAAASGFGMIAALLGGHRLPWHRALPGPARRADPVAPRRQSLADLDRRRAGPVARRRHRRGCRGRERCSSSRAFEPPGTPPTRPR